MNCPTCTSHLPGTVCKQCGYCLACSKVKEERAVMMTKREAIATVMMAALNMGGSGGFALLKARNAVENADALLAELERTKEKVP